MSGNNDHATNKTGIKRPGKISSNQAGVAMEQLNHVTKYMQGEGFGAQLNEDLKKPSLIIRATTVVGPPNPGNAPMEPDQIVSQTNSKEDIKKANAEYAKELGEWVTKLSAHEKSEEYNRKATTAADQSVERITKYTQQHDKGIAVLGSFVEDHKFKQVLEHADFKNEPTLYMAVKILKDIITSTNKTGKLYMLYNQFIV
jgi:Zn-dependent M32 family carboxypeptidase